MTESKKEWVEPELIILVRNQSEESVLAACKGRALPESRYSRDNGCMEGTPTCTWTCDGISAS